MIFKRFFKPKWQHQNAAVRQQAVTELDSENPAHKTVLHELAFNDGAEAVRKVALLKLNDFALWWQASKHESSDRLQQQAEQILIDMLLQNRVESRLKLQFIQQCNRSSILEQLAQAEPDPEQKFSLLQRLNKQELNVKALQDTVLTTAQKLQLLSQLDDEKMLEKLAKQLTGDIGSAVQKKLADLAEQKQLPVLRRKQLTLLLAKLNAARDKTNVEQLPALLEDYQQQWQQLSADIDCLGSEGDEFIAKYQKIINQLQDWLAPRLAELSKQQAAQAEAEATAKQVTALTQQLAALQQQLQQAMLETDVTRAQQLDVLFSQLDNDISVVPAARHLLAQSAKLQQQLADLPRLAEQLVQLTRIVTDWAALTIPDNATDFQQSQPQLQQLQQQWRELSKALVIAVPESLQQAKTELQQQWQQAAKQFNAHTDKVMRQCRSKLAQYRRLYQAGKFKVLFGLFKGIEEDYLQLSAQQQQQQQLAADYDFAKQKMAELADWQEYIATPRKQQLLAQIQQLSTDVTDNLVRQRADEVKQARALWNTFGRASAELEAELNSAFDAACEQAFAPCRAYFAAQDALRAEHVQQRELIIQQLAQLAGDAHSTKVLEQQLSQIKQAWQQAGSVDKVQFAELSARFQAAYEPLKLKVQQAQDSVAVAKQQLIDRVQAALTLDDAHGTASVLKECQQQWKTLGSASRKQDQALWQQFRQLCDGFFDARSQQYQQQQLADQAERQAFEQQLQQLASQLEQADTVDDLNAVQQQVSQVTTDSSAIQQALRLLQEKIRLKQQQLLQQQRQAEFTAMFDLLQDADIQPEQLPAEYREFFNRQKEKQFSREQLTLALELIAGLPSPTELQAQRQQVQLLLLSDKHNQGNSLEKTQLLQRWLTFGPVTAQQLPLLARVKAAFA